MLIFGHDMFVSLEPGQFSGSLKITVISLHFYHFGFSRHLKYVYLIMNVSFCILLWRFHKFGNHDEETETTFFGTF